MNVVQILRRGIGAALAVTMAVLTPLYIFAEDNALGNYREPDWQGDKLYFDDYSGSLYFRTESGREEQRAYYCADIGENTGFFFYADGGNGKGSDSGYVTLTVYDGEGNSLFTSSTGNVEGFANFSRFSIGEENHYYPIPKEGKKIEVAYTALQKDKGEKIGIYFRNFSLFLSKEKPLLVPEEKKLMDSRAGLSKVEVGITAADRWVWIVTVFLVAIVFLIIAKWKQKYSTAKVMKGTDRKNLKK